MADDGIPPWFDVLRKDLAELRADFNGRLDRLVTQDAFSAEQRRVDQLVASLTKDLTREREERIAEDKELETAIIAAANAAKAAQDTQESRKVTLRQGLLLTLAGALGAGVVSVIVLVVQQVAHLGGGG